MKKLFSMLLISLVLACSAFAASNEKAKVAQPPLGVSHVFELNKKTPVLPMVQAVDSVDSVFELYSIRIAGRSLIPDRVTIADVTASQNWQSRASCIYVPPARGKPKSTGYRGLAINCFARSPTH